MDQIFDYSLRVSQRAKYARLLIKPYGGLEVVIPRHFPKHAVADLIHKHQEWISRQLGKRPSLNPQPDLPDEIYFAIDDSRTHVNYLPKTDMANKNSPNHLLIEAGDYQNNVRQLRAWIRKQAWQRLPEMLARLSRQTGLDYQKMTIRSQKTRWGSCSSRGTISLNDQLMFVSQEAVEYLIIHELCHRKYLNHSNKFWQLVARHCPNYAVYEAELNRTRKVIPGWFMADLYR